jgi:hypothetical protein
MGGMLNKYGPTESVESCKIEGYSTSSYMFLLLCLYIIKTINDHCNNNCEFNIINNTNSKFIIRVSLQNISCSFKLYTNKIRQWPFLFSLILVQLHQYMSAVLSLAYLLAVLF